MAAKEAAKARPPTSGLTSLSDEDSAAGATVMEAPGGTDLEAEAAGFF